MDTKIPERHKQQALATLAYHLGQGQRLTCDREEAVTVIAEHFEEATARTLVGACARHGLLAGEDVLWFAPHQTVQEYFAALALRERWQQECQAPFLRQWWCSLRGEHTIALAADDWWAETFVQLAGMLDDDADRLAQDLARVNPWLAWWCVEEGRAVSASTREKVEARSMKLLHSKRVQDRRRAVSALAQMHNERVIEPLFEA
ncbi:MAG: hypothetical protein JXA33_24215, partial [Anaerolineae bacterium]|nr:hypothetical protein [Anaerolineae bacterium]